MQLPAVLSALSLVLSTTAAIGFTGPDYEDLPNTSVFPGPWEEYIQAPQNKSHIVPRDVFRTEGNVTNAHAIIENHSSKSRNESMTMRTGGMVTLEFDQNIGGRVCLEVENYSKGTFVALSYSESPFFADGKTDATGDRMRDLNLLFPIKGNGTNCVGLQYNRGGFKYLTVHMPENGGAVDGFWHDDSRPSKQVHFTMLGSLFEKAQKLLGFADETSNKKKKKKEKVSAFVKIRAVWVICTSFSANENPRAYTGYFDSSSRMLNRIWYAGVYTLQLSTIDSQEGSAIIDFNRKWNHNESPYGSWYSNFSIANGSTVTTDGAKRDRMVWPGDMFIATPGIAVSTYDMVSIRNALNTLFDHQYSYGGLPWAGPPLGLGNEFSDTYHLHTLLGVYIYVLYSGDLNYLEMIWDQYLTALYYELAKVDETGLLHVTSNADWLRPGMTGHNMEASSIMHEVLLKSIQLAHFIGDDRLDAQPGGLWARKAAGIERASEKIWCARAGFYADNLGRRNCGGSEEIFAQDGNSWALITSILPPSDPRALNISMNLRARWGKYGAPAVEFPNTISPFASSFELLGHCKAGNFDAAVELMLLQWSYMLDGPGMTNSTFCEGYMTNGYIHYPAYPLPSRNSHAHGWSSGPTMTLSTEILGIHLDSPLGRAWHISPTLTVWLSHIQGGFATKLGSFEVKVKRMVDTKGRKAQVLDISTPVGTTGRISWSGAVLEDRKGGKGRFMVFEDQPDELVELSIDAEGDEQDSLNEAWHKKSVQAGDSGILVFDDEWKEPVMIDRAAGVVDYEILQENFFKAPWKRGV